METKTKTETKTNIKGSILPSTGELAAGSTLNGEQASALGDVFRKRIVELSRQPELAHAEAVFLSRVVELGARNIAHCLESKNMRLPAEKSGDLLDKAAVLAASGNQKQAIASRGSAASIEAAGYPVEAVTTELLAPIVSGQYSESGSRNGSRNGSRSGTETGDSLSGSSLVRQTAMRQPAEAFAVAAVTAFGDLVKANGDELVIDD